MAAEEDFTDLDRFLNGFDVFDEFFLGLGTVASEETTLTGIAFEQIFPPTSSPMYPFDSLVSEAPPDSRSAQEVVEDRPFTPRGILSSNSPPQITFPVDQQNILTASASTSLDPIPTPPLAQTITFDPPKWRKIPQTVYSQGERQRGFQRAESILFEVDGYPGINMADSLRNRFTGLKNRDDPVLQDGRKTFSCRFLFPGYPSNQSPQVSTTLWNRDRDAIVRSKLAYHIARKLRQYLDSLSRLRVADGSANNDWTIGQGCMRIENMFLARLDSVSRGSFQPEIWVMDPAV